MNQMVGADPESSDHRPVADAGHRGGGSGDGQNGIHQQSNTADMTKQSRTFRFKAAEGGHEFTGERYLPGVSGPIQYEHYHRYLFSAPLCAGKDVLDIASGEGYGSSVLAQSARSVVGVDIDEQAVEAARKNYGDQANLRFEKGSATAIPLADASVDVLNSFETLEHFPEHEAFMKEVRRVLRPGGLMIISTPNRPVYSPPGSPPNEYHVRELDREEFVQWLRTGFKNFVLYEQKPTAGSLLFREGRSGPRDVTYWSETDVGLYESTEAMIRPVYFVALASDGPLPEPNDDVLEGGLSFARYDNARNAQLGAYLADVVRLTTVAMGRGEEIGRLTAEAVRLTTETLARGEEIGRLTAEVVRLTTEAIGRGEEVSRLTAGIDRLVDTVRARDVDVARLAGELTARDGEIVRLHYENEQLRGHVAAMLGSSSWQLTRPWRFVGRRLQPARRQVVDLMKGRRATPGAGEILNRSAPARSTIAAVSPTRFANVAHPRATVVVVGSGERGALNRCLAGLSVDGDAVPYRVLVIGAADASVRDTFGVDLIDAPSASVSLMMLRDGIGQVQGEFVVLISDVLVAQSGWLSAVDEVFARFSECAAVSALILDANGRVESAGSAVDEDARLRAAGRGLVADDARVNAVARVACPGAGFVAVRANIWGDIAPSFSTETPFGAGLASISLLLAERGECVYLQPFARFTRGVAANPGELSSEAKWHDAYARWLIRRRFEKQFAQTGERGDVIVLARRPKVVIIDAFVPKPDQDSGSVDVFWYMRIFQAFGYEISFIAAFGAAPQESYADELRRWGVRVQYAVGLASLNQLALDEAKDARLVVVQRVIVARHVIGPLREAAPHVKIVFGTVDLHHLREERTAIHDRSAEALDAAHALRRQEILTVSMSDATIVVSRLEEEILRGILPGANLHRIPIPRMPARSLKSFMERSGVIFVGGFAHRPNVDAVNYLVEDIWPLVRKRLPSVTLSIVGSNATPEIQALDSSATGVRVVGFVQDLETVFDAARVSVAPLRFGAGVKGKVVSSLIHGLPCVLSKVASEGMGLINGEHMLEGDSAEDIAAAIVRLHEDPQTWARIADAGFEIANAEYSVQTVARKLSELLNSIGLGDPACSLPPGAFQAH